MKISIIVPVFNCEQYLRQCIESVRSQSYQDIEILLVNDGSTDNSEEICKEYAEKYHNISLINKKNGGAADARNMAMVQSTGDYLMFLDSDDYFSGDFLVNLVQLFGDKPNLDFAFFRYKRYFQQSDLWEEPQMNIDENEINGITGAECLKYILENNKGFKWYSWLYVIKREFVLTNNLFFEKRKYYEDILWTPKIFLKAENVAYFDYPAYVYRLQRKGQLTSAYSTFENLNDSIYAANYWYKYLRQTKIDKDLKERLLRNFADNYFVSIWYSGFLKSHEKSQLFSVLKENSHLLKYNNSFLSRFTAILCNTIGYRLCSWFFKNIVKIKRSIKVQLN